MWVIFDHEQPQDLRPQASLIVASVVAELPPDYGDSAEHVLERWLRERKGVSHESDARSP
jgi:hypothetical protein